jgi:hypothetical protein
MRRHVLRWADAFRCAWDRHCAALAAIPDPHGQFPALPLDWYRRDEPPAPAHVPAPRTPPR